MKVEAPLIPRPKYSADYVEAAARLAERLAAAGFKVTGGGEEGVTVSAWPEPVIRVGRDLCRELTEAVSMRSLAPGVREAVRLTIIAAREALSLSLIPRSSYEEVVSGVRAALTVLREWLRIANVYDSSPRLRAACV